MRIIRHLGLVGLTVFALGMTTGVATASVTGGFKADTYPAAVTGATLEFPKISFGGASWNCKGFGFEAELKQRAKTLAQVMEGAECEPTKFGEGIFELHSCNFEFTPASTGEGEARLGIGPSGCGAMTFTWKSGTCVFSIEPQTGPFASYKNKEGDVIVSPSAGSLKYTYTRTKGTLLQCGGEKGTLELTAEWGIGATNEVGKEIGLYVFGPYEVGLFLSGKGSEKEAEQPKLEAEEYPVSVSGAQSAASPISWTTAAAGVFKCGSVLFTGPTLSASTAALSLQAEYGEGEFGGCTFTRMSQTNEAVIDMNSCHYLLHVLNSGPPYSGSIDIACEKEGDAIELIGEYLNSKEESKICSYIAKPQTGLKGIGLETVGTGYERDIAASFSEVPIAIKRTSGTLLGCGAENQTSKYSGAATLSGS